MTSEDRLAGSRAQLGQDLGHQGVKHYLEGEIRSSF